MPNEPKPSKKPLVILGLVLVIGAALVTWLVLKTKGGKTSNQRPIAALRLDLIDETNRVATISDNGSRAFDGTLSQWRIAWGDGKEINLTNAPQKVAHTYSSEGGY